MDADNKLKGNEGWAYEKATLVENTLAPNREPQEVMFAVAEGTDYAVSLHDGCVFQKVDHHDYPDTNTGVLIYDGKVYRYNYAEDGRVSDDMLSILEHSDE